MKALKYIGITLASISLVIVILILQSDYYKNYKFEQKRFYRVKQTIAEQLGCDVQRKFNSAQIDSLKQDAVLTFIDCKPNMPLTNAGIKNGDIFIMGARTLDYARRRHRINAGPWDHDTLYLNLIVEYQNATLQIPILSGTNETVTNVQIPKLNLPIDDQKYISYTWRHFIHP